MTDDRGGDPIYRANGYPELLWGDQILSTAGIFLAALDLDLGPRSKWPTIFSGSIDDRPNRATRRARKKGKR
jgi:hypothetical protein